jgi:uncharacterized lipoprotein YbaY
MKNLPFLPIIAACVTLLVGGCGHITTTVEGDANRVIVGTVNFRGDLVLPPDAEVVVRLVDASATNQARSVANKDLPVVDRPRAELTAQVLGEQTIKAPTAGPVAFRIEYRADDALLRHGLNLDARISYGGRVRLRTVNTRAVTLGNATDMHEIWVEPVAR